MFYLCLGLKPNHRTNCAKHICFFYLNILIYLGLLHSSYFMHIYTLVLSFKKPFSLFFVINQIMYSYIFWCYIEADNDRLYTKSKHCGILNDYHNFCREWNDYLSYLLITERLSSSCYLSKYHRQLFITVHLLIRFNIWDNRQIDCRRMVFPLSSFLILYFILGVSENNNNGKSRYKSHCWTVYGNRSNNPFSNYIQF